MELERQIVDRRAHERPEVLVLGDRLPLVVVVGLELAVVVAPQALGGEPLGPLDERLEVLLGLGVLPAGETNHGEHDRATDQGRPGPEHRDPLEQADRGRSAEAGDHAHQPEPDGERGDRRDEDPAGRRRLPGHDGYLIVRAITRRWISFVPS